MTFAPKAQSDLDEIWDYTAGKWGNDRAAAYLREISAAIEDVRLQPHRSHPRHLR